jgi:cysteine-rich repeat protein
MWVVLLVLSACVQTGDVVCSNGRVCPQDYRCVAGGQACASADQTKACNNLDEGTTCSSTAGPGACFDGACIVAFCGNGEMEPGELCDDGNQFSGDGCNGTCTSTEICGNGMIELDEECDSDDATRCGPTCKIVRCGNGIVEQDEFCDDGNNSNGDGCSAVCNSDETCGNGKVDFFVDEQCDDSNLRSLDGCDSACLREPNAWLPIESLVPPALLAPGAAFDTARNTLVVFGGQPDNGGADFGETWELSGTAWHHRFPSVSPSARYSTAMAYDSTRRVVVMFGGVASGGYDNITWEYDGTTWRERQTVMRPPGRQAHRLVYDSARERIVLFGGNDNATSFNDVWEYDGTDWAMVTVTGTSPAARAHHAMAYDPKKGRIVLFGGLQGPLADTWEYDGTAKTWSQLTFASPPGVPAGRADHTMVFDPGRGQIMMIGGTGTMNETWVLTATGWSQLAGADPDRRYNAAAYDPTRGRVILYGGIDFTGQTNKTSELVGSTWTQVTISSDPPARTRPAAAFDTRRSELVMFGGQLISGGAVVDDMWILAGESWRQFTGSRPPPRTGSAMAYDAQRGVIVLYGGESGAMLGDTWEWNGTAWTQRTGVNSPPGRRNHTMAYDVVRKRIVMFGGSTGAPRLDETWEYDGSTWTKLTPTTKPEARELAAMSYDAKRGRMVLFGGQWVGSDANTWTWDGTNWTKIMTGMQLVWRHALGMTYDAGRDKTVMVGGGFTGTPRADTWEFDGLATWTQYVRTAIDPPVPATTDHALVYDPAHRRVLLLGGTRNPVSPFLYSYGPVATQPIETCASGRDTDGDSKVGCMDDDCWGLCSPYCAPDAPAATCPATPRCGDGTCSPSETCRACPADCAIGTACPIQCGDGFCDSTENAASCPGDCG